MKWIPQQVLKETKNNTHKEIIEYFDEYLTKDDFMEYNNPPLIFSYLMGMPPNECTSMYPETNWTEEQLDEYDDVDSIIHRIKKYL